MSARGVLALLAAVPARARAPAPTTRELERINSMGFPTFDPATARVYFERVSDTMARLVEDTIRKWNLIDR